MKVVRRDDHPEESVTAPLFEGIVHRRSMVTSDDSAQVTVTLVRFTDGARNKRHSHSADQVLYITEGDGIVASDEDEHHVRAGDVAHIPAGEIHWHGAQLGCSMAHLSILPPCRTEMVE